MVCHDVSWCVMVCHADLSALSTVYHTREVDGKRQFGRLFTSGEWFTRWHLGLSGEPGNHEMTGWHNAPTFFTAHASLALLMERSLQSIDPRVAAHYWDYTIDGEMYSQANGGDWSSTFYLSDDWFGPVSTNETPSAYDAVGTIHGRFAGIEV